MNQQRRKDGETLRRALTILRLDHEEAKRIETEAREAYVPDVPQSGALCRAWDDATDRRLRLEATIHGLSRHIPYRYPDDPDGAQ